MQQQAASDEVGDGSAEDYHQLAEQYEPYETDVLEADTGVDHRLGQEGNHKLQTAHQQQTEYNLQQIGAESPHASEQKPERAFLLGVRLFAGFFAELLGRLEKESDALGLTFGLGGEPMLLKLAT